MSQQDKDQWSVSGIERFTTKRRIHAMPMECTPTICSTHLSQRIAPRAVITRRTNRSNCSTHNTSSNSHRSNMYQSAMIPASQSPPAFSAECLRMKYATIRPVWPAARATVPRIMATTMDIYPTRWTWAMEAKARILARMQVSTQPARRSSVCLSQLWMAEGPVAWISSTTKQPPISNISNRELFRISPIINRSRRIRCSPPTTTTAIREWTTRGTFKWTRHITQSTARIPSIARGSG